MFFRKKKSDPFSDHLRKEIEEIKTLSNQKPCQISMKRQDNSYL